MISNANYREGSFAWRLHRALVKRPRGHAAWVAVMKWRELTIRLLQPELWRRAHLRSALLLTLPRNGAVAEIGVWRGMFSAMLRDVCEPQKLLLVDPWSDMADDTPWHNEPMTAEEKHQLFEDAFQHVQHTFAADPRIEIVRAPSIEAARNVPDSSLDAVYIDGAHTYADVNADLHAWSPKLRPGGLLTGDDYYWSDDGGKTFPVRRAVDDFVRKQRPRRWAVFRGQFVIALR